MRAVCIICSELFTSSSDISVTSCGHTFHTTCLFAWMVRSSTCPQCRSKQKLRDITKVFFDTGPDLQPNEDPDYLQNKVGDLEALLKTSNDELKRQREETRRALSECEVMKSCLNDARRALQNANDLTGDLKVQLEYLCHENEKHIGHEKEIRKLKADLKQLNSIKLIVHGSVEDVEQLAAENQYPTYLAVLKKQVNDLMKTKIDLKAEVKRLQAQNDLQEELKAEVIRLRAQNCELREELEAAERQRKLWKPRACTTAKTQKWQSSDSESSSWEPPPKPRKRGSATKTRSAAIKDDDDDDSLDSHVVAGVPKENQRPLSLKACSVAAGIGMKNQKQKSSSTTKLGSVSPLSQRLPGDYVGFNILKRGAPGSSKMNLVQNGGKKREPVGYDGLGGHSKPDLYPSCAAKSKKKTKAAPVATHRSSTRSYIEISD